jgi:hypothetical protein
MRFPARQTHFTADAEPNLANIEPRMDAYIGKHSNAQQPDWFMVSEAIRHNGPCAGPERVARAQPGHSIALVIEARTDIDV